MSIKKVSVVAAAAMALFAVSAQAQNRFANGGFEIAGADASNAQGWLDAAAGYSRSSDAFAGSFSAQLTCSGGCAAVMLQNNVKDGGMADLAAGEALTLSFWTKGDVGPTGNVLFAFRYLTGGGGIVYDSGNQFFQGSLKSDMWSKVTFNLPAVPVGATAAFIEFSSATGPGTTNVLIDEVALVPEPGTYALMLAGLAGVGLMARRRRAA